MITPSDLVRLFAEGMEVRGYKAVGQAEWLDHPDSGMQIHAELLYSIPCPPSIRTTVVVAVRHPRFPQTGLVEFQHAVDDSEIAAVRAGIDQ